MKRANGHERAPSRSRSLRGRSSVLLVWLALWGCASSEPQVLSEPMVTSPVSYTDESSRRLAIGAFQRLPELYEDYRVGPEDVLEVSIFEWELREETKSVEIRVSETGLISLPVIGDMNVKNLTVEEIKASKSKCVDKRKTAEGEYLIPVDLMAVARGDAPNFYLQPDDILYVRQTTLRRTILYAYDFVTKMFTFTGRIFTL